MVSPQFHCVFDDNFEIVHTKQQDTSVWQKKAHLQQTKETIMSVLHSDKLVTAHHQSSSPVLPPYGPNIRNTLVHLNNIVEPMTQLGMTKDPVPEPTVAEDEADELLPQPIEEQTQLTYPVNTAPTGQTRTG